MTISTPLRDQGSRPLGRCLTVFAAAYLVLVVTMTALNLAAAPSGATMTAKLADLAADDTLYRWGFVVASLVPVAVVALMTVVALGLAARSQGDGPTEARIAAWVGILLVVVYAPLSAAAYASQYTVFSWLLGRDPAAAAFWSFFDRQGLPLTIDLLGYAVWGAGAAVIAWPLLARPGAYRWMGWSLAASGVLSIIAFAAHAAGSGASGPISIASGALTVPFAVVALLLGRKLARGA